MLRPQTVVPVILALITQAGAAYGAAMQSADPLPSPGGYRPLAPGEPLPMERLRWHIPDPEHDRLVAEGVAITTTLETEPWGERYFQVTDPNGVIVQLVQWVDVPEQ